MSKNLALIAAAAGLAFATSSRAAMIDLTTTGSFTVNGAVFETTDFGSTGTGSLDSFVRIQHNGTEQGYNTSNSHPAFDEKTGSWTHDLQIMDVGTRTVGDTLYLEFFLDINQVLGGDSRLLSLENVKIYTSTVPSQNTTDLASLGTLRYDLDSNEDNYIVLDASLTSGSGSGDLRMMIPAASLDGAAPTDYLYLYSAFGDHNPSNDGFEEWATMGPAVPAPGPVALLSLGALLAFGRKRR
jgi:hypothetical protein